MKVFVAGATGEVGRRAVAALIRTGHQVTGVARSEGRATALEHWGAVPARLFDPYDRTDVVAAVAGHDIVINLATHIPRATRAWRRSAWAANDRIRSELSNLLVDAALATDALRYVQESITMQYADGGSDWLDERTPVDRTSMIASVGDAEAAAARFGGRGGSAVVLRFGLFYSGTDQLSRVLLGAARRGFAMPPGPPDGYASMVAIDDAATAVVAALRVPGGIYNVTDDEPLTRAEHAQIVATALGVTRARPIPGWLYRLSGSAGRHLLRSHRVSNRRFRGASGWAPAYPSVREGWPAALRG